MNGKKKKGGKVSYSKPPKGVTTFFQKKRNNEIPSGIKKHFSWGESNVILWGRKNAKRRSSAGHTRDIEGGEGPRSAREKKKKKEGGKHRL